VPIQGSQLTAEHLGLQVVLDDGSGESITGRIMEIRHVRSRASNVRDYTEITVEALGVTFQHKLKPDEQLTSLTDD